MSEKEIHVAIFDLNGTLYNKSSKDEFFKFICSKKLRKLRYAFQMAYYNFLLKFHKINQTEFKENFFNYLDNMPPKQVEMYAQEFWKREYPNNFNQEIMRRLDKLRKQGVHIFCATGGLELYVKPLFTLYKVDGIIGTQVEYTNNTYKVVGEACKNEEKVKRLDKHFKGKPYKIIEAHSDSEEDILDRANKAYLVQDGKITPYDKKRT